MVSPGISLIEGIRYVAINVIEGDSSSSDIILSKSHKASSS